MAAASRHGNRCTRCGREFAKSSGLQSHRRRKTPCAAPAEEGAEAPAEEGAGAPPAPPAVIGRETFDDVSRADVVRAIDAAVGGAADPAGAAELCLLAVARLLYGPRPGRSVNAYVCSAAPEPAGGLADPVRVWGWGGWESDELGAIAIAIARQAKYKMFGLGAASKSFRDTSGAAVARVLEEPETYFEDAAYLARLFRPLLFDNRRHVA